ncbi:MAG: 3-oxoacyl-[acyl-carrier-protein] synthase III C-terminal domain-containing protein [Acidimicrobiia bacterium]
MGNLIVGTGMFVPDNVVTNHDLARIMDTTDDWITTRTGVKERRFADPGVGASDLAIRAGEHALADAGVEPAEVDLLITATMTPDYIAPGIAGLVQNGLGLAHVSSYDLRQQCSGFLYALDLADAMISSGRAVTALIVGSEVHAGFLPWSQASWDSALGRRDDPIPDEDYERNTRYRAWSVLFGDGAGAMVLRLGEKPAEGILGTSLHTDGDAFELIWVPGVGFKSQPYVSESGIANDSHLPVMDGGGLYRKAVRLMPEAAQSVAAKSGVSLDEIDLVVAHQANDRILEGVRKQFGMSPDKVPSNIAGYGNTTAATLPILFHELRESGRIAPGSLICFAAFGAGAHYGAALYREPAA